MPIDRRRVLSWLALPLLGAVSGAPAVRADDVPAPKPPEGGPGGPAAAPPAPAAPAPDARPSFDAWLADLRADAAQRGFTPQTIAAALDRVTLIPRVVDLDHQQPEVKLTFEQYLARVVNDARAHKARQQVAENRRLLERVTRQFGVQPRFIVALWAIETNFGTTIGNFDVIDALATLAYDGRRAAFFREQLFDALSIVQTRGIPPRQLRGSWAGAMGQSQFMPSTYLAHAVDFDGDGKADIWHSRADVFASIAKYLSDVGWRADETWGRAVLLPDGLDPALIDTVHLDKPARPLHRWAELGLRRADGGPLPRRDIAAGLIRPAGPGAKEGYLVYSNYGALLQWNRSLFFATAVGYLADRIEQG